MYYGIIFSVDANKDRIDDDVFQPTPADMWTKTDDAETEYECWTKEDPGWHRKWYACLDQQQMDEFMQKMEFASICNTMGSIGAPQPDGDTCLGCSPAFAVEAVDPDALMQAYVTPYVMEDDTDTIPALKLSARASGKLDQEGDWDIVMKWFAEKYKIN